MFILNFTFLIEIRGSIKFYLSHFHVPFWLSYILVYLFYICPSFCCSWNRSIINKQAVAKTEKGHGNGFNVSCFLSPCFQHINFMLLETLGR